MSIQQASYVEQPVRPLTTLSPSCHSFRPGSPSSQGLAPDCLPEKPMASFWKPTTRALARHVARLRQALEDLIQKLKNSIADTVGRVAEEAVREVIHAFLGHMPSLPPS